MVSEKEQLASLLNVINAKEIKLKRRNILFSVLPILLVLVLMYYFSSKVLAYKSTAEKLKLKVDTLNFKINEYSKKVDSIEKIYQSVDFNFKEDFGWSKKDVISKDSTKVEVSKMAHDKIIELLVSKNINTNTTIRYYAKIKDKGKVDATLLKCGFRNIKVFTSSYRSKLPTNIINYSLDAPENNIKVVAFALLRAGIDLKAIEPYPKNIEKNKFNSIEISNKELFENKNNFTITDIKNFKKLIVK